MVTQLAIDVTVGGTLVRAGHMYRVDTAPHASQWIVDELCKGHSARKVAFARMLY